MLDLYTIFTPFALVTLGMSVFDWVLFVTFALIFIASFLTVLYPMVFGLSKTNLSDRYNWGLNIQGFFFLSTVGYGILAVLAIQTIAPSVIFLGDILFSEFVLNVRTFGVLSINSLAGTIAFACLISAQLLMASDLGKPQRAFKIITGKNLKSPLTLDFISLVALTILSFVFMLGIGGVSVESVHGISMLWAYTTLFFALLCMFAHVMLFSLKVTPGFDSKSFDAISMISCGLWSGTAILTLLWKPPLYWSVSGLGPFPLASFNGFLIITIIVFTTQIAIILNSLFVKQKPHNLILTGLSFVVLIYIVGRDFIRIDSCVGEVIFHFADIAICLLALLAVFLDKILSVINYQKDAVLPAPYSMYDKAKSYKPSLLEIGNLVAAFSLVVCITYAVVIFKLYVLPWLISLF